LFLENPELVKASILNSKKINRSALPIHMLIKLLEEKKIKFTPNNIDRINKFYKKHYGKTRKGSVHKPSPLKHPVIGSIGNISTLGNKLVNLGKNVENNKALKLDFEIIGATTNNSNTNLLRGLRS
jgi:hypothetical protein